MSFLRVQRAELMLCVWASGCSFPQHCLKSNCRISWIFTEENLRVCERRRRASAAGAASSDSETCFLFQQSCVLAVEPRSEENEDYTRQSEATSGRKIIITASGSCGCLVIIRRNKQKPKDVTSLMSLFRLEASCHLLFLCRLLALTASLPVGRSDAADTISTFLPILQKFVERFFFFRVQHQIRCFNTRPHKAELSSGPLVNENLDFKRSSGEDLNLAPVISACAKLQCCCCCCGTRRD